MALLTQDEVRTRTRTVVRDEVLATVYSSAAQTVGRYTATDEQKNIALLGLCLIDLPDVGDPSMSRNRVLSPLVDASISAIHA